MGDHHNGLSELRTGTLDQPQHLGAGLAVKVAGGLVGQHNSRFGDQGPGDSHTLLLSARKIVRHIFQFIFQNYNLVPILNVYENIVLPVELDGDTVDQKFLDEIVHLLGLEDKLKNMPNNLSGGQQQRVAIARALITKPAIVLADEPTGNLDSKTSAEVLGLIKRTSAEFRQTVVMITHNDDIARLADWIVRIEDGKIVE